MHKLGLFMVTLSNLLSNLYLSLIDVHAGTQLQDMWYIFTTSNTEDSRVPFVI